MPDLPDYQDLHTALDVLQDKLLLTETLSAIAIEQAMLGTWKRNLSTGDFEVSERLQEIFGISAAEALDHEVIISRIHQDYQPLVLGLIRQSIAQKDNHDIEFPLHVPGKRHIIWVRATGKVTTMDVDGHTYFMGTVMDVTAQRDLEQRKQHLLQSLSHELKTPVIALLAYVQLLERKQDLEGDPVHATILQKMQVQLEKINATLDALKGTNL